MDEKELRKREAVLELESSDPDDLVRMLGLSSEQIIRAFPGHAYDYIQTNFEGYGDEEEEEGEPSLLESGFSIISDPE